MTKKNVLRYVLLLLVAVGMAGLNGWQSSAATEEAKTSEQSIKHISPKDAYQLLQKHQVNEEFVILDVRTPEEFEEARLENAINLNYYGKTFREELAKLEKADVYLVYCRTGNRSDRTLQLMRELKFEEAYNMLGGIVRWYHEDLPIES